MGGLDSSSLSEGRLRRFTPWEFLSFDAIGSMVDRPIVDITIDRESEVRVFVCAASLSVVAANRKQKVNRWYRKGLYSDLSAR